MRPGCRGQTEVLRHARAPFSLTVRWCRDKLREPVRAEGPGHYQHLDVRWLHHVRSLAGVRTCSGGSARFILGITASASSACTRAVVCVSAALGFGSDPGGKNSHHHHVGASSPSFLISQSSHHPARGYCESGRRPTWSKEVDLKERLSLCRDVKIASG